MTDASDTLTITPADREAIFVLSGDPRMPQIAALVPMPEAADEDPEARALELVNLPADAKDDIEVINPADLTGLGLSHYLTEGLGMSEAEVAQDWGKLEALSGPVLLIQGRLAGTEEIHLTLPPGLSLAGRYAPESLPIDLMPLPAQTASGIIQPTAAGRVTPVPRTRAWLLTLIAGLAVMLILLALGLLLL